MTIKRRPRAEVRKTLPLLKIDYLPTDFVRWEDSHPEVCEMASRYRAQAEQNKRLGLGDAEFGKAFVGDLAEAIAMFHVPDIGQKAKAYTPGLDYVGVRRAQVKGWGSAGRDQEDINLALVDRFVLIRVYKDGWRLLADFSTTPHGTSGPLRIRGDRVP